MDNEFAIQALPVDACLLGESPVWHPREQVLYWCDIPGRRLHRYDPRGACHERWDFDDEIGCCAPVAGGGMLLAMRKAIVHFDLASGRSTSLAMAPYDTGTERFNDGKPDAAGRFWVGTIYEPRDAERASLYRLDGRRLQRVHGGITTSNGLAWSPDGRTMYWSDTKAHTIYAMDYDAATGQPGPRRQFARLAAREPGVDPSTYGGRPDGAAVDAQGGYWVAMFEGGRLLRLSPEGRVVRELRLPVRCPTMPCFGGPDLKTLYVTTSREHRPAEELAREPLAGCVLELRVDIPGLPANLVHL
jgi:sugar lactone lactonase YvrE